MLDKLVQLDKELLVWLNGFGSESYDAFWLFITVQFNWIPFFALILFLLYRKLGLKNFLIALGFIAVLILICDQTANFVKDAVKRLRPCNDPELKTIIRIVKQSDTFSYFSGHATNSMASVVFVWQLLRTHYRYAFLLFGFPLIFAYSRIYLGLHFPLDILSGYLFGGLMGYLFYKIYKAKVRNL